MSFSSYAARRERLVERQFCFCGVKGNMATPEPDCPHTIRRLRQQLATRRGRKLIAPRSVIRRLHDQTLTISTEAASYEVNFEADKDIVGYDRGFTSSLNPHTPTHASQPRIRVDSAESLCEPDRVVHHLIPQVRYWLDQRPECCENRSSPTSLRSSIPSRHISAILHLPPPFHSRTSVDQSFLSYIPRQLQQLKTFPSTSFASRIQRLQRDLGADHNSSTNLFLFPC